MSLSTCFSACTFAPSTGSHNGNPPSIASSGKGSFKTTSFFMDSSGHSSFLLPLEIKCENPLDLEILLASKCILPEPSKVVAKAKKSEGEFATAENESETIPEETTGLSPSETACVGFEVKNNAEDDDTAVIVEGISILSTSVNGLVISFETEVTVSAAKPELSRSHRGAAEVPEAQDVMTNLKITPILTIKSSSGEKGSMKEYSDLASLELGAIPDSMQKGSNSLVRETWLTPITLQLTLTHAFMISVTSLPGPSLGSTLVSLTIRHSNTHREPVTINNIAIHPGHSRYEVISTSKDRTKGGQYSVTNMTKAVQWGYAPQTALRLPLTLNPYDAYSTVLNMTAGEEMHSRLFISPVSITGIVGRLSVADSTSASRHRVVVAADAHWATEIVAVEPADAFRVFMTLEQSEVVLGEPMVVNLRIFNLSLEPRNLMLLMAKEDAAGPITPREETVNTAVVSEINGYTFGVWGISPEDDGTFRLYRDNELLAMDGALLLGEVLGQHSVDAALRFVPLRSGRLEVPNWKLYDKSSRKWYTCVHNLCVIAN